jgi:PTH1 family peptidyl-tRNA hydrolase
VGLFHGRTGDNLLMIRMLVGLGNPGPEYEGTRHNAGFWWLDAVATHLGAKLVGDRAYQARVARVNRGASPPIWLLAPQTYMNLSGLSVSALARFYKIEAGEILVVHDELDLQPGQMKIKQGGGAAGHNGLKDIQAKLGSPDFWRLRLGVGHPGVRAEVIDWVLRKPAPEQREAIIGCITRSLAALPLLLDDQISRATMMLHTKVESADQIKAGQPTQAVKSARPAQPTFTGVEKLP